MDSVKNRIRAHKNAKKEINDIINKREYVLIIHYSCEGFNDVFESKTPRIASIVVKNFDNGQTKSFSVDTTAEKENLGTSRIMQNYDSLEKIFLDDFFAYVKEHPQNYWINWNMRNIKYGFEAINQRYRVLGGAPFEIDENHRLDLSRIFDELYGEKYIKDSKLIALAQKNNFNQSDLLNGKEEAEAFQNGEFAKIHLSTLRKVELIDKYLRHSSENRLKTDTSIKQIYGLTPQGIFELAKENWVISLVFTIIGIIICSIITMIISKLFTL